MSILHPKQLIIITNDGGGLGKSELAKLTADRLRLATDTTTGLIDGDPKNHSFLSVFGNRDDNGGLVPPAANDLLSGCRVINLRDPEASAKEMFAALEEVAPDRIVVDGAGGSETNLGLMIMKSGEPVEFVEALSELGYGLVLASPLIPETDGGKAIEALTSLKKVFDLYGSMENVHFLVSLNKWVGDLDDPDHRDPRFDYWFNSGTRKRMLEASRTAEIKVIEVPGDVMSVASRLPVPYSRFIDPEFAKKAEINIKARMAIRKHRDLFGKQVAQDPLLRELFREAA